MNHLSFDFVGRFNEKGIDAFSLLLQEPLKDVLDKVGNLVGNLDYVTCISHELKLQPVKSRLEVAESLHTVLHSNSNLEALEADQGMWSWLAAAWMPLLFENSPRSAKIGERARWILDKQKTRYYRHLLAGPYFIYRHHYPNPEKALSILGGPVVVPGELVGQIAASSDIAYSVGAEVATLLYFDPITGRPKKGSGGSGAGSPRRLTAAYLNQIDLTVDYRGMNAQQILAILPREFDIFK